MMEKVPLTGLGESKLERLLHGYCVHADEVEDARVFLNGFTNTVSITNFTVIK